MLIVSINSERPQNKVPTFSFGPFVSDTGEERVFLVTVLPNQYHPREQSWEIFFSKILFCSLLNTGEIQTWLYY